MAIDNKISTLSGEIATTAVAGELSTIATDGLPIVDVNVADQARADILSAVDLRAVPDFRTSIPDFRPAYQTGVLTAQLGPLADLAGRWEGSGFNIIARPDFQNHNDIFLQLNLTTDTITFTPIPTNVPNRGSGQADINLFGLTYLQSINDANPGPSFGGGLHIEPGIWMLIPATTDPLDATQSVARMGTIPHGNAVLLQGKPLAHPIPGPPPAFAPVNTVPFPTGGAAPPPGTANTFPEYDLGAANAFRTNPLPPGITQAMVTDPSVMLQAAIAGQTITQTQVLDVTTPATTGPGIAGGAENIAFLEKNAQVGATSSVFWLEHVREPHSGFVFLQLQYTQTVILNFLGLSWPHVTVATLRKGF